LLAARLAGVVQRRHQCRHQRRALLPLLLPAQAALQQLGGR
jgi:hypothetical protein